MNRRIVLGLLPLIVFFSLTVGTGLLNGFLQSLFLAGPGASSGVVSRGVLSAYRDLLARPEIGRSFLYTVYIAGTSAVLSVSLGAVFAWVLRWAPRPVRSQGVLYHLPIILPHIIIAFITMVLWAPSGIFATIVTRLGVDASVFSQLLYSPGGVGMILAYVYKEFPFVTLMALGVLRFIPEQMIVTARMLGAGPLRTFHCVGLPAMRPILVQVFIILFLYALGGFEIPWLLGASRPQMIPVTVYSLYFQGSLADRPVAMAALSLLALFAALFVVLYTHVARRFAHAVRPV